MTRHTESADALTDQQLELFCLEERAQLRRRAEKMRGIWANEPRRYVLALLDKFERQLEITQERGDQIDALSAELARRSL